MTRWMVAILAVAACSPPAPSVAELRDAARVMLARSQGAWNRGDLEAFLSDYAADSATGFVAEGRVHYGFDWIRQRYAPAFRAGADRDSLRFESVAARPLGPDHALITARYALFDGERVTSSGPFTLVMHRTDGAWKIIHDHTSRDPE